MIEKKNIANLFTLDSQNIKKIVQMIIVTWLKLLPVKKIFFQFIINKTINIERRVFVKKVLKFYQRY